MDSTRIQIPMIEVLRMFERGRESRELQGERQRIFDTMPAVLGGYGIVKDDVGVEIRVLM